MISKSLRKFDVFLSYNSKERELVHELAMKLLDEASILCWFDIWDVSGGADWEKEIENVLNSCYGCAVFIGEHGLSDYQLKEINAAIQRQTEHITPFK